MTEIEADYLRDEKRQLELRNIEIAKAYEELKKENARLRKESEENQDLATIAYIQGASKNKAKLDKAKEIINEFFRITQCVDGYEHEHMELVEKADAFLKETGE